MLWKKHSIAPNGRKIEQLDVWEQCRKAVDRGGPYSFSDPKNSRNGKEIALRLGDFSAFEIYKRIS